MNACERSNSFRTNYPLNDNDNAKGSIEEAKFVLGS